MKYYVITDYKDELVEYDQAIEWHGNTNNSLAEVYLIANDFYNNHDGWEMTHDWKNSPLTFRVWTDEDSYTDYLVELEYEPSFHVTKKVS